MLTKTTNYGAFSKTITHVRDQNGNNLSITSETGTISYLYDADNRITQITDQNGGVTTFQYDGMGNQTVVNYPNGVSTFTTYDPNGNVISVITQTTPPPPPAGSPGQVKTQGGSENDREILFETDYAVIGINSPISGPGLGENEIVSITVMNQGMVILPEFMVSFVLDDTIAFVEVVPVPIFPMETYDHVFSQTVDLSIPGEDYFLTTCVMAFGDENPMNNCMDAVIFNAPLISIFQSFNYAYDVVGNKVWEGHMDGSFINYEYSPRNELLTEFNSATSTFTEYTYYPGGQRETMTINELITNFYLYNPDGTLLSAGGTTYIADNVGNRTSMTDPDGFVTEYMYGYNYELLQTDWPGSGISQFWYSAQGDLLKESQDGIITFRHYLEKEILTELDGSGNPTYVYNPRLSLSGDPGTGYLFYDGSCNSTLELGPDQSILAMVSFDHYGNTTGLTGSFLNDLMVFNSLDKVPGMSAFTLSRNDLPSPWLYDPQTGFSYNFNINGPEMGPETPGIPYGPDGSDPTPRPKGIPNPDPPTEVQTCCCCVKNLNIKSITPLTPPAFGHLMKTEITLEYKVWSRPESQDCTLEWWEKSNEPPDWYGVEPNTWNDMYQNARTRASFNHSWGCRTKPCPPPYTVTVVDEDPPSLAVRPGRTVTRVLEFAIRVKSAPDCPCSTTWIAVFAKQQLKMVNGVPQRNEASSYLERGLTNPPSFND
jgi:YD repeat-containing protein